MQCLRDIRQQNSCLNQKQISQKLNVCQNTYSQYETGKRQMPIKLIPKMAKLLNCTIEEIVLCFCDEDTIKEAL